MTTRVWVERPITSVEDAEGLPVGTVAVWGLANPLVKWEVREGVYRWGDLDPGSDWELVGWTGLVPVEATEETLAGYAVGQRPDMVRRLVTAWEVEA